MDTSHELALRYNEALPPRIRRYLNGRGIVDYLIDQNLLGWNEGWITIPIFNRVRDLAFFKLAKDPDDKRPGPKMIAAAGSSVELYGWERVKAKPSRLIICEGEFDRLVLESNGFAAVTSTGGAGVFRTEWAEEIRPIPEVFICFDRDEAGRAGARRIAEVITHAKIVELPEEIGNGGDVTDFFVRLRRTAEEFTALLERASPAEPREVPRALPAAHAQPVVAPEREVDRLKAQVPIEAVVGRYAPLALSGQTYVGLCPFHEDHHPSLAVYPESRRFYCFGCQAHGDVIEFLMRVEHLRFPEALAVLRQLASAR